MNSWIEDHNTSSVVAAANQSAKALFELENRFGHLIVAKRLATSVADLQSTIAAEVNRVMTTPPSGVAALGPPDPQMAALVAHMKAQLDADKAAAAGGGHTPLGTGKAAPDQNVTYSVQSLMGSSKNTSIRADQFNPMVKQFNDKLKTLFEKSFTAEVK